MSFGYFFCDHEFAVRWLGRSSVDDFFANDCSLFVTFDRCCKLRVTAKRDRNLIALAFNSTISANGDNEICDRACKRYVVGLDTDHRVSLKIVAVSYSKVSIPQARLSYP